MANSPETSNTEVDMQVTDSAGSPGPTPENEAPPRRTRTRRAATPVASASPDSEIADEMPEAKRAPRRRSQTAASTEPSSSDTPPESETPAMAAPPVRRSRTTTRSETPAVAETPQESAEPTTVAPPVRRSRRPKAAEPVVEEPTVAPSTPVEETSDSATSSPPQRQRYDNRDSRDSRGQRNDQRGKRGKPHKQRGKKKSDHSSSQPDHPGTPFVGMLEMIGDKNFGFIRAVHPSLPKGDNDAFMPPPLIDKFNIRDGALLEGTIKPGRKGAWQVAEINKVMGVDPDVWKEYPNFDLGVTIYPDEKLNLVTGPTDVTMRVIDLVAPIGKGQRALIVAPPRAGKTVILKQMARSLSQNHPEVHLVALLIDERPEEVTDFRRNTDAEVFASSNDYQEDNHIRVATMAFEYCRRLVEMGKDVVLLLDSLTRLGRTFNLWGGTSGRTMSGGLDARALVMPRKIFGAARNIENGGSLTIVATALVETGSRMDDVIFEEFKGTGNSEIVLDRELADKRIFPAINLRKSGTRNIDQLIGMEMVQYHNMLLRALNSRHPVEAMEALIRHIQSSPDNVHLLNELVAE